MSFEGVYCFFTLKVVYQVAIPSNSFNFCLADFILKQMVFDNNFYDEVKWFPSM